RPALPRRAIGRRRGFRCTARSAGECGRRSRRATAGRRRAPTGQGSKELRVVAHCADVLLAERRDHAPAWRALQEAELEQVRLVHILDRVRLLAAGDPRPREPHPPPPPPPPPPLPPPPPPPSPPPPPP